MLNFCPKCGNKLFGGKFCANCGADLSKYGESSPTGESNGVNIADSLCGGEALDDALDALMGLASDKKFEEDSEIKNGVLIKYNGDAEDLTIPDYITTIGDSAFYDNQKLTSITLSENVKKIGIYAFSSCKSLRSVKIPDGVMEICNGAFERCESITEIYLPDSVELLGSSVFERCISLKKLRLSKNLDTINRQVFGYCLRLFTIFIPRSVTTISSEAFHRSSLLDIYFESEVLPENCAVGRKEKRDEYGNAYFGDWNYGCYAKLHFGCREELVPYIDYDEESIKYGVNLENYNKDSFEIVDGVIYAQNCHDGCLKIPYGVNEVRLDYGYGCFKKDINLWAAEFPVTAVKLGHGLFRECKNLTEVNLSERLIQISGELFAECVNLRSVTLPNTLKIIEASAFRGCISFKRIEIPDSIEFLGSSCFELCENLEYIKLPIELKVISRYSFNGCKNLKEIEIPKEVIKIDDFAFSGCAALENVIIPNGVAYIGKHAFYGCKSLKTVVIPASVTYIDTDWKSFRECDNLQFVYLPRGRKDAFKNAFSKDYGQPITFIEQ